jgi:hypothetical protein
VSEPCTQQREHTVWFVHNLAPADPDHVPARQRQLEIPPAVLVELVRGVVGRTAVRRSSSLRVGGASP